MIDNLSALDTGPAGDTPTLAAELDTLGFHRFWTSEHHTLHQSGSPTVMATLALGVTQSLRIGTAGVMLLYQGALRVAKDFHLLESFFSGRVDVGVIPGVARYTNIHEMLSGGQPEGNAEYEKRVRTLATLLLDRNDALAQTGTYSAKRGSPPQLWVCGISSRSAQLAAEIGAAFAYSPYLAERSPDGPTPTCLEVYHQKFKASGFSSRPQSLITCYGVCSETSDEAYAVWDDLRELGGYNKRPDRHRNPDDPYLASFVGASEECHERLQELARLYGVNEVAIMCKHRTLWGRIKAYTLIARTFDLGSRKPGSSNPSHATPESRSLPLPDIAQHAANDA